MRKVALGVKKSLYPLGYNKNNPMESFNEWAEYIRRQNYINSMGGASAVYLISIDLTQMQAVLETKGMNSALDQANQILNNK
ncbi:hypothetical protein FAZ19_16120 [Sphingobacterium alkalisoli]|uniref:Uncharacterized protein n=1 Tax=Sphingobacterium alkalisoli TaxID=1874115 RepID=A0A4U0H0R1_9SPHI|nr:hypothetical protein [Sphingobacterium alkalisoli]TJY63792.1 hypothetical protein FAZ19_16120 [Sphingobacterium alkalisoli]GGH24857.1 hypothetical protein GCM10011418_33060 [Sphingobacterium alkalisoli]